MAEFSYNDGWFIVVLLEYDHVPTYKHFFVVANFYNYTIYEKTYKDLSFISSS